MNKKAIASLAIGMLFMLMNINTTLAFAEEQLGLQIEKNLTLIMQGASHNKAKKDINSATYKADLKLIKEFKKNEKLVLHLSGNSLNKKYLPSIV